MNADKLKSIISKKTHGDNDGSLKLFQMFYFERLLERISKSNYKNGIILKGGVLLSSIIGDDERTTKDMDTTLKGIPLTKEKLEVMFNEILNIKIDDGVSFSLINIKDIWLEDEYGGFRLNILASLDKNKTYITVEVTTGDVITPREIKFSYNCIFEDKKIFIMSYTLETIIAEKFQTIISRGVLNTRLKDFYDVYVLMNTKLDEINLETLKLAIKNTFNKRETKYDISDFYLVIEDLKENNDLKRLWIEYQNKNNYSKNINYIMTIESIEMIIKILEEDLVAV